MVETEKEDLPFERGRRKALEKEEAMKIIGDLIAGDIPGFAWTVSARCPLRRPEIIT